MNMEKKTNIEMHVSGLSVDPLSSLPFIILKDNSGNIAIPIWIGMLEASSIATQLENIKLSRPMTHDLLKIVIETCSAKVEKVVICDLKDNTFYALIHLVIGDRTETIDARPSDAIALALRAEAPIFVDKEVIEKSRRVDLSSKQDDEKSDKSEKERLAEILENLDPDDFGKYKM